MNKRRVVVTGMGALTPIGNDINQFWQGLSTGTSGADAITRFDTTKFKTKFAAQLKDFKAEDYLNKKEIRTNDPYLQYALIASDEALKNSDLNVEEIDATRVGVIWGTGNGGIQSFQDELLEFAQGDGTPRFNPYFIPKIIVNMAAGVISIKYGLKGICFSPVSACATGNTSIIEAANYIRWGQADVMIAGGSDAAINESGIAGFNANKALSTRNDDPKSASRPFDKNRDGFVMGEGAGALILESLEHAQKRGAKIYGEYLGGAQTSDAYHLTATHPDGEGAQRGMRLALQDAGLDTSDVDYINLHATSTPLGDLSEVKSIHSVFSKDSPVLSATKSMTGHLLGAAGAVEGIACILAINKGVIPATINTTDPDDQVPSGVNILFGESKRQEVRVAMSNTFGFGGHNAIVVFGAYN